MVKSEIQHRRLAGGKGVKLGDQKVVPHLYYRSMAVLRCQA